MDAVKLIGLDFGTTTSSAVVASARLLRNSVTGRVELREIAPCFRSDLVFTPLCGDRLDEGQISEYLDTWLEAASGPEKIFGGGALLTGLTAQKDNADALVALIRRRLGNALVASARDPCLESWLAFMGNCATLSRNHPERWFLNLDIGGGTTNLALGRAGEVVATGCFFVGARHLQFEPGAYRLTQLSPYGQRLLEHLRVNKGPGEELSSSERDAVVAFYLRLLEAAIVGRADVLAEPIADLLQQVPFRPHERPDAGLVVTLSGGVGELVYAALHGKPLPSTTFFGDLGIDLAGALLRAFPWSDDLRRYLPEGLGRATVYGLLRHSTQVSGSTIFLADAAMLPLADVPILGTLSDRSSSDEMVSLVELARRTGAGSGLRVRLEDRSPAGVRDFAGRLGTILRSQGFPARQPLVLLVAENVGKVLGHYVTGWGALPLALLVLDEIAVPEAHYVHIGPVRDQVIPVSFYGLQP